jgi:hypothetical protein
MNMVRAGVVSHPMDWEHGGFREIQEPRTRKAVINHEELCRCFNIGTVEELRTIHRSLVEKELADSNLNRNTTWSQSIAVGSPAFVEGIKKTLGAMAAGRKVVTGNGSCELREPQILYNDVLGGKNDDLGVKNAYLWETSSEKSAS